jgi:hypothetical protein
MYSSKTASLIETDVPGRSLDSSELQRRSRKWIFRFGNKWRWTSLLPGRASLLKTPRSYDSFSQFLSQPTDPATSARIGVGFSIAGNLGLGLNSGACGRRLGESLTPRRWSSCTFNFTPPSGVSDVEALEKEFSYSMRRLERE